MTGTRVGFRDHWKHDSDFPQTASSEQSTNGIKPSMDQQFLLIAKNDFSSLDYLRNVP
jgi:hypothetical protein